MRKGTVASTANRRGFHFIEIFGCLLCGKLVSGVEVWHFPPNSFNAAADISELLVMKTIEQAPHLLLRLLNIFYFISSRIRSAWISGNSVHVSLQP
jgi:hypothetical protein